MPPPSWRSITLWRGSISTTTSTTHGGGDVVQQGDLLVDETSQEAKTSSFQADDGGEERKNEAELGVHDLPADPKHWGEQDLLDVHHRVDDVLLLPDDLTNVEVWQWDCD